MANRRLQAQRAEHDKIRSTIEKIENNAADANREVSEDEQTEIDAMTVRSTELAGSIADLVRRDEAMRETSEILGRYKDDEEENSHVRVRGEVAPKPMTPGEYAGLVYRSQVSPSAVDREEAHNLLLRVVAETGTGDTSGILPTPIIGDLVKFVDASRPVITSMRPMPMPDKGKTFSRPRLTQSTQSGTQTEKSQLTSRQLTTTGDTVTKATHGTVLRLTEQDMDWSEPALLDIAYEDMAEQYAIDTETSASTAIAAAATTTTPFDITTADAAATIGALALGAVSVYNTAKRLPDTIYAAVDVWGFFAALVDSTGRPLFPNLAPMNAPGTLDLTSFEGNPMGLRLVVSPHFSSHFLAVGASRLLEQYEQNKGFVTVNVPSVLEQEVAYRGYFAANVYAQGLCSLQ